MQGLGSAASSSEPSLRLPGRVALPALAPRPELELSAGREKLQSGYSRGAPVKAPPSKRARPARIAPQAPGMARSPRHTRPRARVLLVTRLMRRSQRAQVERTPGSPASTGLPGSALILLDSSPPATQPACLSCSPSGISLVTSMQSPAMLEQQPAQCDIAQHRDFGARLRRDRVTAFPPVVELGLPIIMNGRIVNSSTSQSPPSTCISKFES